MKTCVDCGGELRGWTGNPANHTRCAACDAKRALAGVRLAPAPKQKKHSYGVCACCGKYGRLYGWGLIGVCYQKRRRLGMLESWKETCRHV